MPGFNKQNYFRRTAWGLASLMLVGCEVGSSTKALTPYRSPSSGTTSVGASSPSAEVTTALTVQVTVNDKSGYGIQNVVPTITAVSTFDGTSTGVTSGGCGSSNIYGVATCTIRASKAGTYNVKVLTPVQATMATPVTFYQVPRALSFSTAPSATATSNTAFTTQPVVTVLDATGTAIPGGKTAGGTGSGQVTLSLTSTSGGSLLPAGSVTATANALSGKATFANLYIDVAGTSTLTASLYDPNSGTITGVSSAVVVSAATAVALKFSTSPSATSTGVAFSPQPVVTLVDSSGNTTKDSACLVTLTMTSPNAGDQFQGTVLSMSMGTGVADFTGKNLRISRSGAGSSTDSYTLTATASGSCSTLPAVISSSFTVSLVGLPSQLTLTQAPGTAALNQTWSQQPIVQVLDDTGTVVAADNSTVVVMDIFSHTSATLGVLAGTASVQVVNGVATFSGLSIPAAITESGKAGDYTYRFRGFNNSLTITPAYTTQTITSFGLVPAALVFHAQPTGNVAIGAPLPQFTVEVVDSLGYPCTFDQTSVVNVAFAGTGSMVSSNAVTVVNGVATFNGTYFTTAGAKQIIASGSDTSASPNVTFTAVNSNVFVINPYGTTADHLKFTTQPSSTAAAGSAWSVQPVVAVVDAEENTIASDSTTIVTINCVLPITCPGNLIGNVSLRVTNGVANFSGKGLHLGGSPGTVEVSATSVPAMPVAPTYSAEFNEP